ncbi:MAG: hypothetical protein FD176_2092 [Rhodospirillaceae bacterium]|nr:MAG: hypothetical protein FD176_2092 [Rhodospirillaceae bacterium]TNC96866.1 MAG: Uncharacterized protein FD119_1372 [Stygiobacter sp.]
MLRLAAVMGVLILSAVPALAQPMGGPPPEAFTACDGKDSGAECSHPTPSGTTMTGTCQPRGDKMQCIPSRSPGGGAGGMSGGRPALDERGNETGFPASSRLTFDTIPVPFDRLTPVSFTLPGGETHWYEVVHLPQGGVNWVQAKSLAEQAGGYLATLHSTAENDFVFALISDRKFWFEWDHTHNFVMNGPFLGGFQPAGASEPKGGWRWVNGEAWSYENWARDGMSGDNDLRNNTQPNDATGNQNVLAFGEVNKPVSTWGDFPHRFGTHGEGREGRAQGFIIEYDKAPR